MKTIINDKLYDTEQATEIIKYLIKVEHKSIIAGMSFYPYHYATIYRTKKGSYLKYVGADQKKEYKEYKTLELISESEVKKLLIELNEINKYIELFGAVEEG